MTFEGILPVWKPAGMTSHDVVAKARRILGMKRIGHTGTLDPAVTGVLPLCLGRATRMVEYIQDLPKQYEAEIMLGVSTDTEDRSGNIVEELPEVHVTKEQIIDVLQSFKGDIDQTPPMYSAVKVDGKRLYELARSGIEVERKSRRVTIYSLDILSMELDSAHPTFRFRVECSKGTYIRTLCVDIGKKLGVPAVMNELVRTGTGNITPERCLQLEQIEQLVRSGELAERLIPADQAVGHLPSYQLSEQLVQGALSGKALPVQGLSPEARPSDRPARLYAGQRFVGLYEINLDTKQAVPVKIFS
ncbi:tRNA pseudouridine(55) synthase TruB [Paenibacillus sp. y28]|uniref:tRNA pseudouridine(55) synthase TruB n=1 Tax=Paenibacillus sp. y28 TaxID=3129110 RepID=UPI00301A0639